MIIKKNNDQNAISGQYIFNKVMKTKIIYSSSTKFKCLILHDVNFKWKLRGAVKWLQPKFPQNGK